MIKLNIQRFGHTNSTSNYELPQFVGTDKPQWLTDINQAFASIDTAIHSVSVLANLNSTKIGDLTDLTTDNKLDLVSAINEVDSHTDSNTNTIAGHTTAIGNNTTAIGDLTDLDTVDKANLVSAINEVDLLAKNNENKIGNLNNLETTNKTSVVSAINSIISMFDFNDIDEVTASVPSGYTIDGTPDIKVAKNSDGSLFKIYGNIVVTAVAWSSSYDITLTNTGLPAVDSAYTINNVCDVFATGTGGTPTFYSRPVEYQTNGDLKIKCNGFGANSVQRISINPCLYFNKNFGDTPSPTI